MEPLISVIIPIYGVEKWIYKCIDSIINQTYQNLEIILVDDESPDNCGAICDEYAKKDGRVKVIHKKNGRQGAARNSALDISTGEYIAFVDGDDWIEKDMYEKMISAIFENNADMAVCGIYNVTPYRVITSSVNDSLLVLDNKEAMRTYYSTTLIHCTIWNKLYSRELWDGMRFPEDIYREDEYVFYRVLARTEKTVHIGEAKYYYNIREGSTEHSGFRPEFMILTKSIDLQYEFVKENYPELTDELYDRRIRCRYNLIKDIIFDGIIQKNKKEYDEMIGFLKVNEAKSKTLRAKIKRFFKFGKLVFVGERLIKKAKDRIKRIINIFHNGKN